LEERLQPYCHYRGDLIGLTIVDAQRRVREPGGELVLDLPARANAEDLAHPEGQRQGPHQRL
jgi:hypothetical protein